MNDVWILGAGFSKSLGGPLLVELFSSGFRTRVEARASEALGHLTPGEINDVFLAYGVDAAPWTDAEMFLVALDTAARDPKSDWARNLARLNFRTADITALQLAAAKYVAFATDFFVPADGVVNEREDWAPYCRWATSLKGHSVISFNYDRVVEAASGGVITPMLPRLGDAPREPEETAFYKLHGSVTWTTDGTSVSTPRFGAATGLDLLRGRQNPFLGLPGPGKYNATRGPLASLWTEAMAPLRAASRVHIVGFRFPPGDTEAKQQILTALQENDQAALDVRIVLGPTVDGHSQRVVELVRWSLRRKRRELREHGFAGNVTSQRNFTVEVVPMNAEDYVSLYDS